MKNKRQYSFPPEIAETINSTLRKCYTCNKCVSGCPMAPEMDLPPSMMVKWLALDEIDKVLASDALWLCSSCQNCYSRCPFEINIPHIIDTLKEYADKNKIMHKQKAIYLFHKIFLSNIKRFGRIHEASFIGEWKIRSGNFLSDILMGVKMFLKGKLKVLPEKIKKKDEVRRLFDL